MERLKQYRINDNLSMQDMADLLNISKTYYWQLEHNQRRLSYNLAIQIANIFKMKPDDIFYEDTKKLYFQKKVSSHKE